MHFSHLLTAFLATLVVATPIANSDPEPALAVEANDLVGRETLEDTEAYTAAIGAHPDIQKGKYYWFELTWDLKAAIDDDHETKSELEKLRKKLGFKHIALVVGEVTEKESGKGKNKKTKRDFNAMFYDMVKDNKDRTESHFANFKGLREGQTLKWGGDTTKSKANPITLKRIGTAWVEDHPKYSVDDNHSSRTTGEGPRTPEHNPPVSQHLPDTGTGTGGASGARMKLLN
ncbi:hypothetical protein F5B20DRAFT_597647 [Whalleya microplaca]|nr:hypothetical protein F5B20DRAFT_597647 [Whalleya microplaca]